MIRPTVVLFDIDGTLITQKGTGRRAVAMAFERLYGRPDAVSQVTFAGRTDPLILGDGLAALGIEATPARLAALSDAYLAALPGLLAADARAAVLPGVERLLGALAAAAEAAGGAGRSGLAVGLGTGNSEAGARIKLEHFGLWSHFGFGGYGSDAADRAELLGIGAARGAARLGRTPAECRLVVVGDTPLDVAAARAIGAACLAVCTGGDTPATLSGADLIVDDLTSPDALAFLWAADPPPGAVARPPALA